MPASADDLPPPMELSCEQRGTIARLRSHELLPDFPSPLAAAWQPFAADTGVPTPRRAEADSEPVSGLLCPTMHLYHVAGRSQPSGFVGSRSLRHRKRFAARSARSRPPCPVSRSANCSADGRSLADRLTVIRSMTHQFTNHIAGTYITLTGSENQPDRDREAHSDDFPGPGAVLNYLPGPPPTVPRSVSLPNWLSIPGPSNRMPGQYAGMLGGVYDPFLIDGDPNQANYDPLSLNLPQGMTTQRLETRLTLLQRVDRLGRQLEGELSQRYDRLQQSAYDLVADGRVRNALDLSQEPDSRRDQYGRNKFGQSLLLARRLIEAGVTFVGYNDFNQKWDTHGDLAATVSTDYSAARPGLCRVDRRSAPTRTAGQTRWSS